jgi:hypothetical protein
MWVGRASVGLCSVWAHTRPESTEVSVLNMAATPPYHPPTTPLTMFWQPHQSAPHRPPTCLCCHPPIDPANIHSIIMALDVNREASVKEGQMNTKLQGCAKVWTPPQCPWTLPPCCHPTMQVLGMPPTHASRPKWADCPGFRAMAMSKHLVQGGQEKSGH